MYGGMAYTSEMKEKKEILVKRTYRITKVEDQLVKRNKKKFGSESKYIRKLIREGTILK